MFSLACRGPCFCSTHQTFNMSWSVSSPEKNPFDKVMNADGPRASQLEREPPLYPRCLYELPFHRLHIDFPPRTPVMERDRWQILARGWSRMSDSRRRRLVRNLRDAVGSGYFGGMGGLGLVFNMICWEVNKHVPDDKKVYVKVNSECEYDPAKQKILASFYQSHRASHIFSNIFSRLPQDVQDEIGESTPTGPILKDAKLLSNRRIKRIISDAYRSRGAECNTSHCILHGRACPIDAPRPENSPWRRHRVRIAAGGVPCVDQSSHGLLEGEAGKAAGAHHAFFQDVKHRKYSVVFTECTYLWDAEPSAQEVSDVYLGCECVLCPRMVGDAYSRKRRLVTLFNKDEARIAEPLDDYEDIFEAEAMFTFHELFNGSVLQHDIELASTLKRRVAPVDSRDWLDTLLPLERERRENYLLQNDRDVELAKAVDGDPSVFDLENNPLTRPRRVFGSEHSTPMFCLVSHGTLWNERLMRPMLLEEWLGCHMVPTFMCHASRGAPSLQLPCDFLALVEDGGIKASTLKSAVGNGWHIGVLASWVMFVLSSVEFKYDEEEEWPYGDMSKSLELSVPAPAPQTPFSTPPRKKMKTESDASSELGSAAFDSSSSGSPWLSDTTTSVIQSRTPIVVEDSP